MDNQRLLIWAFFGLMAWITYQTWQMDYGPRPVTPPAEAAVTEAAPAPVPDAGDELPTVVDTGTASEVPAVESTPTVQAAVDAPVVRVTTDVLDLEISTQGATLQSAILRGYPVAKDRPDVLVQLLSPAASDFGLIQTGLVSVKNGADHSDPTHEATFSAAASSYDLGDSEELVVPFTWTGANGVQLEKRFVFTRGSYAIRIEQALTNGGSTEWRGAEYAQIRQVSREVERSMFNVESYSFIGPIVYDGKKSEKLDRDDLLDDPVQFSSANGWLGTIRHHFVSAIVPEQGTDQTYRVSVSGDRSTARTLGGTRSVAPGETAVFATTTFVGPKLQAQLDEIHDELALTVDYGWLTIVSKPMFIVLSFIFDFVGNWGVAIMLMTLLIKLIFYKLTESSGRSMAKMRALQPRMKALQDRYKDDRQALSQAMMDLYKREKVNPAAGCLPILIQMPFFLAFYWVLLESVEMRQAPFALWITDLSTRDPYFILPLIMGAAMLFQQKLNPAPADPVQAKVMQIMPIMFTVFFAFFPSGLVLYWVTNTVLSIAQQWKINRVVEAEEKKRRKN